MKHVEVIDGVSYDGLLAGSEVGYLTANYKIKTGQRVADANGNLPEDFIAALNPNSLIVKQALIEPSVRWTAAGSHYQFLRLGYFVVDNDTTPDKLVFNRVVGLKDTWAKVKAR